MAAQTIAELTNHWYNELKYSASETPIKGDFMATVVDILDKCKVGINPKKREYDQECENAVRTFQGKVGLNITGILNNATWKAMLLYASNYSNTINENESPIAQDSYGEKTDSPHFNSFFSEDNTKTARINRQDIKIVFGNKTITKTIKDVYMRSVSVEVDTSGNPISETYEFIARDVIETDEVNDLKKYTKPEHYTSSDVQYTFNIGQSVN